MSEFTLGIEDHQNAVHAGAEHAGTCEGVTRNYPETDTQGRFDKSCVVCRDNRFISKMNDNALSLVCKECFGRSE